MGAPNIDRGTARLGWALVRRRLWLALPNGVSPQPLIDGIPPGEMAVTPEQLGEVELQEIVLLAAGTGALLLATVVVVDRRRPA